MALIQNEDPLELALTSVGRPLENVELKMIDRTGEMVPVGQTGEICCRSFSLMRSYWGEEEKTREVIDSACWYHTG